MGCEDLFNSTLLNSCSIPALSSSILPLHMFRSLLKLDMHNEMRKQRYNIKYYVGCEDLLAKYIKETCGLADFTDDEILTALGEAFISVCTCSLVL